MRKTLLLLVIVSLFQHSSFSQDTTNRSLKTALANAKEDTTRLRLYIALAAVVKENEKPVYSKKAVALADELLKRVSNKQERKQILAHQIQAYNKLVTFNYESTAPDADKILVLLQQLLKLNTEIADRKAVAVQQLKIAGIKMYKNDTASFFDYLQKSITGFREVKDSSNIVSSYQILKNYYLSVGNFPKGLETIQTALSICKQINYKKGIAHCLLFLADLYRDNGEGTQALHNYDNALAILYQLKDTSELFGGLAAIGGFYYKHASTAKAIESYQKLISLCEAKKELNVDIPRVHKWMGQVYKDAKDYTKSLYHYEKSLALFRQQGDKSTIRYQMQEVLTGIGDVYTMMENFSKAADYHLQAANVAREIKYEPGVALAYLGVGRARLGQKNYALAKQYSQQALQLLKKQFDVDAISKAELLAFEVDSASGNGMGALAHYKEYVRLRDQLRGDEIRKAAQKERYEAEQEKREAISNAELKQEQTKRKVLYGGIVLLLIFGSVMFNRFRVTQRQKRVIEKQKVIVEKEKQRSETLLLNILPGEVAEELKETGHAEAKLFDQVTVMFTDFKGFTQIAETLSPKELVAEIHACFEAFDHIVSKHNIEKIKTIGDSYMCAGGLPVANKTNAIDVVRAALEIQAFMQQQLEQCKIDGKQGFEIRIGVHTGSVVAGIVGVKKFAYDIWGDTVNIASRMESSGEPGKVNISGPTHEIVKTTFMCRPRGKIKAKNKGEIDMYFVESISEEGVAHPLITKVSLRPTGEQ